MDSLGGLLRLLLLRLLRLRRSDSVVLRPGRLVLVNGAVLSLLMVLLIWLRVYSISLSSHANIFY
jgi:hypothetical protein